MDLAEIAAAVRQPEYTGENRCTPCTVVNVAIAAGVAALIAIVSGPAGVALFIGCLLAIYLRGYLVPGTPELTKRYLPPAVLRLFGKEPAPGTLGDPESDRIWDALETVEIVERGNELSLSEDFRSHWLREMDGICDDDLDERAVERLLDAESAARRGDRAFSVDGNQLVRWDSRAAFLADVAAAAVLEERLEDWGDLDRGTRRDLLERLRLLLDRCPDCDGSVRREAESVDPCCQKSYTVVWNECGACGALLGERSAVSSDADGELDVLVGPSEPLA